MTIQENHRFKLVIFDLDGTLTQERSIWEYIHVRLGKWYGFAEEYQNQFLASKISYEEFCERDAEVWKGMKVEKMTEIVKTVPFHSGAEELISHLKQRGLKLSIVSSGLSVLSDWVHQKLMFDYSVSNDLLHENGVLSGKVRIQVHYDKKAEWAEKILKQFGATPEEAIAIGDSKGDIDMFQMAGVSVAFNSSCAELDQVATVCIRSNNLVDIIPKLPI
ncbi:MAG: HAD-IB family phosphatase [Deltaproteobacteria bacterium]|nr:HAD-IB family phosphatase [Deltaproteobacteria bacterium]